MGDNLTEMQQQGQALRDLAAFYSDSEGRQLLETASRWLRATDTSLTITGMGSSLFAGRMLGSALAQTGWLAPRVASDELLELLDRVDGHRLLLTSQSGKSGELVELTERFPGIMARSLVVTNDVQSPLALACPHVLPLCAGVEDYSATKTFTNTLALFHLLGAYYRGPEIFESELTALPEIADAMDSMMQSSAAAALPESSQFFIGCDYTSQAVAEQAALLSKEVAHRTGEYLSFAAFLHGTQEVAGTAPAVTFIGQALTDGQRHNILRLRDEGIAPFLLTGQEASDLPSLRINASGLGFTLLATMAVELWICQMALAQGLRPGHYQVGAKVTAH